MNKKFKQKNGFTRRGFGHSLFVFSAYPLISKRINASEKADVIIIGAGLAGLNAALNLEQEGYKVIVLEGDDYVGGRAHLPVGARFRARVVPGDRGPPHSHKALLFRSWRPGRTRG